MIKVSQINGDRKDYFMNHARTNRSSLGGKVKSSYRTIYQDKQQVG